MSVFKEPNVWEKLKNIERTCHRVLLGDKEEIPGDPGRDIEVRPIRELPPKQGLSFREGQGRLLHDLASIELQAMELGLRTLTEFPRAPAEFRTRLAEITLEEAKHLRLCLEGLEQLGLPWGSFPTHNGLWQSVSDSDCLLDRILIVHRYLEGAGLDASDHLLNRLTGVDAPHVRAVVKVIAHDELAHVEFGSFWYREICKRERLEPETDFKLRLTKLIYRIPRRLERINPDLRKRAGFTSAEIEALNGVRDHWLAKEARIHPV